MFKGHVFNKDNSLFCAHSLVQDVHSLLKCKQLLFAELWNLFEKVFFKQANKTVHSARSSCLTELQRLQRKLYCTSFLSLKTYTINVNMASEVSKWDNTAYICSVKEIRPCCHHGNAGWVNTVITWLKCVLKTLNSLYRKALRSC